MDSQPIPDPNDQISLVVCGSVKPFAPWQDPGTATNYGPIPLPAFTVCGSIPREAKEAAAERRQPVRAFRVSLRRLAEVSPFFRHWSTSIPCCFEFEVVDLDAFAIVIDMIHRRSDQVPAYVGLDMLAKIAEIVSYLKCRQVLHAFPNIWMENLWKEGSYLSRGRELVLWVHIAQVFQDPTKFRMVTLRVMMMWGGKFDSLGLSIHSEVIKNLNKRREDTLFNVFSILHRFVSRLRKGETKCGSLCEATLLGSIFKQLPVRYFMPPPLASGVSNMIVRVLEDILDLEEPRRHGSDEKPESSESDSTNQSQSNAIPNTTGDCSEHERECGFKGLANDIEIEVTRMQGLHLPPEPLSQAKIEEWYKRVKCVLDAVG